MPGGLAVIISEVATDFTTQIQNTAFCQENEIQPERNDKKF
jgi:hypothetical protein